MSSKIQNNKRIAKNTLLLYFRMLITLLVSLYTSRVVLNSLGFQDFGIYNVVGGIVIIFTIVNSTLAAGTQRFLTFELGKKDSGKVDVIFSTAFFLHIIIALLVVLASETIGLWFLNNKMNIDVTRIYAANYVYQFSIVSVAINIIQVPFMSSVIAHEKMSVFAYLSIFESVMRLVIAFMIQKAPFDTLIFYAGLVLLTQILTALIYNLYCRKNFKECRFSFKMEKPVMKEMLAFSGWNVMGCGAVTLQGQGVNILLNMFCGTVVNAARGIAVQVNNVVVQFVNNFQTATTPQIVKLYSAGELKAMQNLVFNNSKFAAYLMTLISIPLFIEIEYVLKLWLKEVPEYTAIFIRIILIQNLITTMSRPIVMVVHAVGKMKWPNVLSGGVLLLIVPVSYVLLKIGYSPVTVFWVNIIPWILEPLINLMILRHYIGFPIRPLYTDIYPKVIMVIGISSIIPVIISYYCEIGQFLKLVLVTLSSVSITLVTVYYLGINKHLREVVNSKIKGIVTTKFNRIWH